MAYPGEDVDLNFFKHSGTTGDIIWNYSINTGVEDMRGRAFLLSPDNKYLNIPFGYV